MRWLLCLFGFHQFDDCQLECKYHNGVYYYKNRCIHCGKEYNCEIEEKFFFPHTIPRLNNDLKEKEQ